MQAKLRPQQHPYLTCQAQSRTSWRHGEVEGGSVTCNKLFFFLSRLSLSFTTIVTNFIITASWYTIQVSRMIQIKYIYSARSHVKEFKVP